MACDDWTPERLKQLEEMHRSGASYDVMARHFAVTRNAIAGKVSRLRLPSRPRVNDATRKRAVEARSNTIAATRKKGPGKRATLPSAKGLRTYKPETEYQPPTETWEPIEGSKPVSLCDLNVGQCKWPVGDDKPRLFCGMDCEATYCVAHAKIAIRATTEADE